MKKIKFILTMFIALFTLVGITSCAKDGQSGLSAYDIAIKNGFEGSETEWLESLKGSNGVNGEDGENAESLTLTDIYNECVNNGYTKSFMEFVSEYFSSNYSLEYQMNKSLLYAVSIDVTWNVTTSNFLGQTSESTKSASGSGVFYKINKETGDAYIITNYHVVYNYYQKENNGISENITCYIYGSEIASCAIEATFIGGASTYDLAMLKVEGSEVIKNSLCEVPEMASEESLYIGQSCYAVGNNKGKGIAANAGNISYLNETSTYSIDDITCSVKTNRFSCDINGGNSGGGLFNEYGELIGIVCCKVESSGVEGMCYAITPRIVKNLTKRIYDNYISTNSTSLDRVLLGITISVSDSYAYFDTLTNSYKTKQVISIYSVNDDSLFNEELLVDDILVSFTLNGETYELYDSSQVSEILLLAHAGDSISFNIKRSVDGLINNITINSIITENQIVSLS